MSATRRGAATVLAVLDRPRLWRVTAALSALLLCGLVLACMQGSFTVLARQPQSTSPSPAWVRWCTQGEPRQDRRRLAFCARVDGRVLSSTSGPDPGEAHIAVLGDFHVVIVLLPDGTRRPPIGAHIVAIGPLFHARDGEHEVQAFRFERA